jgi:hypothetical protein
MPVKYLILKKNLGSQLADGAAMQQSPGKFG